MQPPFELLEGEKIVWSGRMSYKANWYLFLIAILTIPTIIVPIVCLIVAFLRVRNSKYFITNRRVYAEYGLMGRQIFDIKVKDIEGYIIKQGFFGKIFNYGDIVISTSGQLAGSTFFKGISNPMRIRTILERITERRED